MKRTNLNQFELINLLAKYIEEKGIKEVIPRHFNSLIKAANVVIEEFSIPYQPAKPGMGLKQWLSCDDVGASSRWLASYLSGYQFSSPYAHPHDFGDFNRCLKMIEAVPELSPKLQEFLGEPLRTGHSKHWVKVFQNWNSWKDPGVGPEKVSNLINEAYKDLK